jgi:hypothetical protein
MFAPPGPARKGETGLRQLGYRRRAPVGSLQQEKVCARTTGDLSVEARVANHVDSLREARRVQEQSGGVVRRELVRPSNGHDAPVLLLHDLPVVLMNHPVMPMAEKDEVVEIGRPAVDPVH